MQIEFKKEMQLRAVMKITLLFVYKKKGKEMNLRLSNE